MSKILRSNQMINSMLSNSSLILKNHLSNHKAWKARSNRLIQLLAWPCLLCKRHRYKLKTWVKAKTSSELPIRNAWIMNFIERITTVSRPSTRSLLRKTHHPFRKHSFTLLRKTMTSAVRITNCLEMSLKSKSVPSSRSTVRPDIRDLME